MRVRLKAHRRGFTLMEFMVVAAVLAILVVIFLPRLNRPPRSPRINCLNNLKMVGLSFRLWALDDGENFPMQVSLTNGGTMELAGSGDVYPHFLVMSNELNTPKVLFCQADQKRKPATAFTPSPANSNISYFVGLDANESTPQMLRSGDDCLTVGGKPVKPGLLLLSTNATVAWTKARHNRQGNVGLAGGSVISVDTSGLQRALFNSSVATNRLAMP